ncbi:MAG: hypothetical protein ACP5M9_03040, partial [Candidatus Micrarchaeia archaeon]
IGRILGYKKTLRESTFSKVRERSEPMMFQDLINWIVEDRFKQLDLANECNYNAGCEDSCRSSENCRCGKDTEQSCGCGNLVLFVCG